MSKRLGGEIAIVTGSDSGIGQAIAIAFAREGADVTITYNRDKEGAEVTLRNAEKEGARGIIVHVDVADPKSVKAMFAETKSKLGVPTILVNNAGTGGEQKPVAELTDEGWEATIRTDLFGPFYCCKEFINGLDGTDKHGSIINVTSVHEDIPGPGNSAYCAAKGGLRNLTRCLALELADKNINVNNLAPGMILTPMNDEARQDPKKYEAQIQTIPLKRAGLPEEIANAAVYLASRDALYVHGTTLFVDGGLLQNKGRGS
jgi:glucose 1-dehydrogenase